MKKIFFLILIFVLCGCVKTKNINITFVYGEFEVTKIYDKNAVITNDFINSIIGCEYEGVYYDSKFVTPYNNDPITQDTTLYINKKDITVKIKCDELEQSINLKIGDSIDLQSITIVDSPNIEGLFYDSEFSEEYEGEKIFSSTILFVKKSKVVVTFKMLGYEEQKTFDNGVIITKDMISLIKDKYIEGLYFDSLFTEKYENTPITRSTTLYINAPNFKNIYNDIIEVTDDSYITLYEKEFRPSGVPGMPIFFNHIDDVYEYHLIIDESSNFIVNGKKNNVVREQEVVYFSFFKPENVSETSFLDIIVKKNNIIIGYCIVKMEYNVNGNFAYKATLMKGASFVYINDQYQSVSDNIIEKILEESKKELSLQFLLSLIK